MTPKLGVFLALSCLMLGTDSNTHLKAGLPDPCVSLPSSVTQITSSSPSHPANSFYYPRLKSLPPIAKVTFVRLRQSPRAFAPPSLDLASRGNEIVDSLSGNYHVSPSSTNPR